MSHPWTPCAGIWRSRQAVHGVVGFGVLILRYVFPVLEAESC